MVKEKTGLRRLANVGPAMERDLGRLGFTEPDQLIDEDAFELYARLCDMDGRRHDPCVLDTFMSVVDQANGGPPRPWWEFTPERKRRLKAS